MEEKKAYNYKSVLEQPNMVQKLTKGYSLNNPLPLFDVLVYVGTVFVLSTILLPLKNLIGTLPAGWIFNYGFIPYGVVQLFKKFEPDGKKIHRYVWDYILYWFRYGRQSKKLHCGRMVDYQKEQIVYKKIKQ